MGPGGNLALQVEEDLLRMLVSSTHQASCQPGGLGECGKKSRPENNPFDIVTLLYKYFNYTSTFLFILVLSLTCIITREPHFSIIIVLTIYVIFIIFDALFRKSS